MGDDQVAMSRQGINKLIQLALEQHESLDQINMWMRDLDMYEGHWFDKGFLQLFQDDYDSATDDVFQSFYESIRGTRALAQRIAGTRDLLHQSDAEVDRILTGLRETAEAVQVPEFVKGYGGLTNMGGIEPPPDSPPKHRGPGGQGSMSNTIDAVNTLGSLAHHTDQIASGTSSQEELEEFVEDNDG